MASLIAAYKQATDAQGKYSIGSQCQTFWSRCPHVATDDNNFVLVTGASSSARVEEGKSSDAAFDKLAK